MQEEQDFVNDVDIDWTGLFVKVLRRWKMIVIVTAVFGALGIFAALKQKPAYGVTVTLAPEIRRNNNSNSLGTIASMMGMNLINTGTSVDALNITMFPDICKSTPFLTSLFDVEVTRYISPKKLHEGAVPPEPTTVYDHILGNDRQLSEREQRKREKYESKYYYDDSVLDISALTPRQRKVAGYLKKHISADVDQKTGVTKIFVSMDDRRIATQLADTVCTYLQQYVFEYRTRKAQEDLEYYEEMSRESYDAMVKAQAAYAASVDYDRSVILQSVSSAKQRLNDEAEIAVQVYTQMVQQRELARAKVQELRPVFAVVQPATMPVHPMNSRKKKVLLFGFAGFCLALFWAAFGADALRNTRRSVRERLEESGEDEKAGKSGKSGESGEEEK